MSKNESHCDKNSYSCTQIEKKNFTSEFYSKILHSTKSKVGYKSKYLPKI